MISAIPPRPTRSTAGGCRLATPPHQPHTSLALLVLLCSLGVLDAAPGAWASDEEEPAREAIVFRVVLPSGDPAPHTVVDVTVLRADGTQYSAPVLTKRGQARIEPAMSELWRELNAEGRQVWLSCRSTNPARRESSAVVSGPHTSLPEELKLEAAATVVLHLRDEDDRPLPIGAVNVMPLSGRRDVRLPGWGISPSGVGRFRLALAPDVRHVVTFAPPHGFARGEPAVLTPPFRSEITLAVKRQVRRHVQVLDGEGRPVAGARVGVRGPGAAGQVPDAGTPYLAQAVTDARGIAPFEPEVARASASVHVAPPQDRPHLAARVSPAWRTAKPLVVVLTEARSVRGVVRDALGNPLGGATLLYRVPPSGDWRRVTALEDGRYVIPHLTAAAVDVAPDVAGMLRAHGWWNEAKHSTRLNAGSAGADLVLDLGQRVTLRVEDIDAFKRRIGFPDAALVGPRLSLVALDASGRQATAAFSPDGTVHFHGLTADGGYAAWASWAGSGMYVLRKDIRAKSEPYLVLAEQGRELLVRLKPAALARGFAELSGTASVAPGAFVVAERAVGAADTLIFRGLPRSPAHLRITATQPDADGRSRHWIAERDVDLRVAQGVDMHLKPAPVAAKAGGSK